MESEKTMHDESKTLPPREGSGSPSPTAGADDIYIDPQLERSTVAKFDKYVLPQMALLIILAYLDRSNIGECTFHHHNSFSTVLLIECQVMLAFLGSRRELG